MDEACMNAVIKPGVWTAIVTPFDDQGRIDWKSFTKLLQTQVQAGVSGVVLSGTTGEAPTLSNTEKIDLIKRCRTEAGRQCDIMVGSGGNDTAASVQLSQAAMEAGADSVLVVTPPYNKPSQAGLVAHFTAVASAIKAPVCLYHVPGRTAQRLTATSLAELTRIPYVTAIKEASGDIQLFQETLFDIGKDIQCLSGDDFII